ncbi:hypothetical protein ISU10_06310 [Nocardioides agariphilus]|jgi:hypothetical protein|uniref:Uncharacterized protein n=1 Tax=Nocardioides agariphilus TaxID=433664 RepID=A0A930VMI2_9ACTN|nr:hypothetical protein [Nocardioides agariphilus]MBF4767376.1 hypothetical protein [Nocardioides agariphilus]
MWTPWSWAAGWGRSSNLTAVENARVAAVACSRALVERIEVELYVADVLDRRRARRPRVSA